MAYYDALIEAWNNPVQPPPGVKGAGLTEAMTTDEKLVAVNEWTVTGSIPTTLYVSGVELLNCIHWDEFVVLQPAEQQNLLLLCSSPGPLLGGTANVELITDGMFMAYFPLSGPTIAALTALAVAKIQLWWSVSVEDGGGGLSGPVSHSDLEAAGIV